MSPPYKFESPFKQKGIRLLACSACYIEIVRLARNKYQNRYPKDNFWHNTALERRIDKLDFSERRKAYDKLLMGKMLNDDTIHRLNKKFNKPFIRFWKDFPLWGLLAINTDRETFLKRTYSFCSSSIKEYSFEPGLVYFNKTTLKQYHVSPTFIKNLTKNNDLTSFMLLTAWAIDSQYHRSPNLSYLCAMETRKRFPQIVCEYPHFYIQWRLLAVIYGLKVWAIQYEEGFKTKRIDSDADELEIAIANERSKVTHDLIPPDSIMDKIKRKFPGNYQDLNNLNNSTVNNYDYELVARNIRLSGSKQ